MVTAAGLPTCLTVAVFSKAAGTPQLWSESSTPDKNGFCETLGIEPEVTITNGRILVKAPVGMHSEHASHADVAEYVYAWTGKTYTFDYKELSLKFVPPSERPRENEKITIERRSRGGKSLLGDRAFLYSKIDGEPYVLECVLSHSDCVELPPNQYEIARLVTGEGSYKNCPNVDVYRIGANRLKEKPLGEYCLDYMQDYEYRSPSPGKSSEKPQ
jgi:hypothetical protein